jgi:hypothetical protein
LCLGFGATFPCMLGALLMTLPTALAGAFAGALAAGLAGALAAALAAGLSGCTTSFLPRPSSATGSRDPSYDVGGKDTPFYSWSRNLLQICCIQDLFLRFEQQRRGRWLGDVGPLENLQGDFERPEQLPSWFATSCKLRVRHARSP